MTVVAGAQSIAAHVHQTRTGIGSSLAKLRGRGSQSGQGGRLLSSRIVRLNPFLAEPLSL
jgi:hypothetical protein